MASAMATGCEVFYSFDGEIDVSVGMKIEMPGFAVGGSNRDLF